MSGPSGNDPSWSELRRIFGAYHDVVQAGVSISESRIGVEHTGRQQRVIDAFNKTLTHCMAMEVLLCGPIDRERGILDHFTIAMIARSVMDGALMVMYLSKKSLTEAEWRLRRAVLHIHDLFNRKRFLEAMINASDDPAAARADTPFFENYPTRKARAKERIAQLGSVLSLDADNIRELQKGQKVFIMGVQGAVVEAGWDRNRFEAMHSYYSAFVHTHPVSFLRMDEHHISWSHPSNFQIAFVITALNVVMNYMAAVNARMDEFTGLFERDPLGQVDL